MEWASHARCGVFFFCWAGGRGVGGGRRVLMGCRVTHRRGRETYAPAQVPCRRRRARRALLVLLAIFGRDN